MPSAWQKVVYTQPICITIRLPFVSRYFFRSIRVRGRWDTPKTNCSGKKKEPKPKLFGPDIFGWGGGLAREGVGAKKFGMSFETHGNQIFLAGHPRILPGKPGGARKVRGKKVCVQFSSPNCWSWLLIRVPIRPPPPTSADFPSDSGWEK